MIDKIVYINQHELHIIYDNRAPVTLHSDENVLQLLDWMHTPSTHSLEVFNIARASEDEVTMGVAA